MVSLTGRWEYTRIYMKNWARKNEESRGAKARPTGGAVRTAAAFTTSAHVEPGYSGAERRRRTDKEENKKTAHKLLD